MALTLSKLTITERALHATTPVSNIALHARDLANTFISAHGGHHAREAVISFLKGTVQISFECMGTVASLPLRGEQIAVPSPYGLKGGAAREELVRALGIRDRRAPRDIDLVRRSSFRNACDDEMARTFMTRDYLHGARVELINDLSRHLATRDITINEVVVFDPVISVSLLGALDTIGHVLRPTSYRGGTLHRKPSLDGKVLLKMIRLYAEGLVANESWSIVGIPSEVSFSEFDLAVHLNKAFQRGRDVAEHFLHTCQVLSLIPAREDLVRSTLDDLEHLRHGERGLLPDVPSALWETTRD